MRPNSHGQGQVIEDASPKICQRCRKPVRAKRKGSLTGWIFGSTDCSCSESAIKKNRVRHTLSGGTFAHTADTSKLPNLGSKYDIIELVGQGGMGNVYKVKDRASDRILAVKTLRPELASDEKSIKRFKREAMTASRLSHDNVVSVYGYSESPTGSLFLVMDFVEGLSLEQHLRFGKIEWQEALDLFIQICDALSYAHKHGVVHRDMKPGNIIISETPDGRDHANILDLGISKLFSAHGIEESRLTQTGDIVGSPLYMSPEQCQGESVDERTDIYSFGCVMYEVLTGEPPFAADNSVKIILKHINASRAELMPVLTANGVPKRLQEIIVKGCLSSTASDRFETIDELKRKLELFIEQSRSASAAPSGEKSQKFKTVAAIAVVGIVLAGSVFLARDHWDGGLKRLVEMKESFENKNSKTDALKTPSSQESPSDNGVNELKESVQDPVAEEQLKLLETKDLENDVKTPQSQTESETAEAENAPIPTSAKSEPLDVPQASPPTASAAKSESTPTPSTSSSSPTPSTSSSSPTPSTSSSSPTPSTSSSSPTPSTSSSSPTSSTSSSSPTSITPSSSPTSSVSRSSPPPSSLRAASTTSAPPPSPRSQPPSPAKGNSFTARPQSATIENQASTSLPQKTRQPAKEKSLAPSKRTPAKPVAKPPRKKAPGRSANPGVTPPAVTPKKRPSADSSENRWSSFEKKYKSDSAP